MAKDKLITCEVLTTVKGLDPKALKEYTHAGTAANPTLIELPENAATAALIEAGTIRIYPGPAATPQLPESDKVKALQAKIADLESEVARLGVVGGNLLTSLKAVSETTDLEAAVKIATEALV